LRRAGAGRIGSALAAVAVAAATAFTPTATQAVAALFRAQLSWFGPLGTFTETWPPAHGPNKAPPATATIGPTSPAGKVVLPRSFIDYYGAYSCTGSECYTIYSSIYSIVNGRGSFRPNNPFGAAEPTTIVFPTTLGNPVPNRGSGEPRTPSPTFSGQFDFSRAGSMMIEPGPNRFSGSMRLLYGPNTWFFRLVYTNPPYVSKAYGTFKNPTEFDETEPGEITSSGVVSRFRLTEFGYEKAKTPGGAYISARRHYLNTLNPWTTGRVSGYQPLGSYLTRQTHTGYDNRTANGANGVLSLVRPRLVHAYEINSDPTVPISTPFQALRTTQLKVFFLPEPGAVLLLAAGLGCLMVLRRAIGPNL